jgi:hypothetical protein
MGPTNELPPDPEPNADGDSLDDDPFGDMVCAYAGEVGTGGVSSTRTWYVAADDDLRAAVAAVLRRWAGGLDEFVAHLVERHGPDVPVRSVSAVVGWKPDLRERDGGVVEVDRQLQVLHFGLSATGGTHPSVPLLPADQVVALLKADLGA